MNYYTYQDLSKDQLEDLLERPKLNFRQIFTRIEPIIEAVEQKGDGGIQQYNEKFDGHRSDPLTIDPSDQSVDLDEEVKQAIDTAFDNISKFHEAQRPKPMQMETMEGIQCMQEIRPIERVGLYIPGGTAVLPSTALMLGVPAYLAGCSQIVLATPTGKQDQISSVILYIGRKLDIDILLKAGGAQAIAAMAYGTESVPKVDKIFGPGNQYVTAAKMMLQNSDAQISIDLPAGPSEVLVVADDSAEPDFVAADLLSQAEHGSDSQVALVHTSDFDLSTLRSELDSQLKDLPRSEVAAGAMEHSFALQVDNAEKAIEFSNQYAPEHLILQCAHPQSHVPNIHNAGSVFLGPWSPESVGDYASGTNHTLPTYGYARMYSGVSLLSFMKQITFQQLSREGLRRISNTVTTLAEVEGLEAHKRAVTIRLNE